MTVAPTILEPTELSLQSVRYVASPTCIIPTSDPDLWGVFAGWQVSRDLIGIMTTEEMLAYFRQSWLDTVTQYNTCKAAELTPRTKVSTLELDDILADLNF